MLGEAIVYVMCSDCSGTRSKCVNDQFRVAPIASIPVVSSESGRQLTIIQCHREMLKMIVTEMKESCLLAIDIKQLTQFFVSRQRNGPFAMIQVTMSNM